MAERTQSGVKYFRCARRSIAVATGAGGTTRRLSKPRRAAIVLNVAKLPDLLSKPCQRHPFRLSGSRGSLSSDTPVPDHKSKD